MDDKDTYEIKVSDNLLNYLKKSEMVKSTDFLKLESDKEMRLYTQNVNRNYSFLFEEPKKNSQKIEQLIHEVYRCIPQNKKLSSIAKQLKLKFFYKVKSILFARRIVI